MNSEYIELSHEKAVLERLCRFLRDNCIGENNPERIIAENLPMHSGEVPTQAVMQVLRKLSREVSDREDKLQEFRHVKLEDQRLFQKPVDPDTREAPTPPESKAKVTPLKKKKKKVRETTDEQAKEIDPKESTVELQDDGGDTATG